MAESQPISTATWERSRDAVSVAGTQPSKDQDLDYQQARRVHEFMQDARERFKDSVTNEEPRRKVMLEDLKFRAGFQWDPIHKAMRDAQGRPSITQNRVDGFVAHVVNNMRQQRPEIKIDPIAAGADEEIASVRQGLIRHIELDSCADIAYDTAFENMATTGLGYMRVLDAWADDGSFDNKDLKIEWLPNSFSVYEDPAAAKPDWSDGKYKWVTEEISLIEFRRRFGKDKAPVSLAEFKALGDDSHRWLRGDKIRIAEYFHVEDEPDTWWELPDGSGEYESKLSIEELQALADADAQNRPKNRPVVYWTLMYGLGILKERVWPGKYIPIIPCIGNQIELEGERIIVGMVRYAKEAQRMFNYMYSSFVEACALAPKSPFVAEFDQVSEFLNEWQNSNKEPTAVLRYRMKASEGLQAPAPRREQAEPPIQAFVEGLKLADENMKSAFRIFDASLGQRGPQESGIAINSRKVESDLSTYNWLDNFTRCLRFLGIVLNDLLQYYYNKPGRIIQILQEDLSKKAVVFNQEFKDDKTGQTKIYDLSQGKFAITISTGPSFPTRRRESSDAMLQMAKIFPQQMSAALPMIIRTQDWPGKDALAAQVEKTLPPELQQKDDNAPPDDPEQLKQVIQQMSQQIQVMSKALGEATDKWNAEERKELWNTFRTQMNAEVQLAIAEIKTGSDESKLLVSKLFEEMERIRMATEAMMAGNSNGQPGQSPQSSAAPAAQPAAAPQQVSPAGVSAPPAGGSTPAEVGIGT